MSELREGRGSPARAARGYSKGLYIPGISENSTSPDRLRVSHNCSKCVMWPRSHTMGLISGSCWTRRSSSDRGATNSSVRSRASASLAQIELRRVESGVFIVIRPGVRRGTTLRRDLGDGPGLRGGACKYDNRSVKAGAAPQLHAANIKGSFPSSVYPHPE
jgi:hypothetical protein